MGRRKIRLHLDGADPWIDIRRSSPASHGDPDGDWIVTVVGVVLFIVIIAWLIS